jgi:hypothetical protein
LTDIWPFTTATAGLAEPPRLVGEHDTRIWRLVHYHVEDGRTRVDMSEVVRIGIDETGTKLRHKSVVRCIKQIKYNYYSSGHT